MAYLSISRFCRCSSGGPASIAPGLCWSRSSSSARESGRRRTWGSGFWSRGRGGGGAPLGFWRRRPFLLPSSGYAQSRPVSCLFGGTAKVRAFAFGSSLGQTQSRWLVWIANAIKYTYTINGFWDNIIFKQAWRNPAVSVVMRCTTLLKRAGNHVSTVGSAHRQTRHYDERVGGIDRPSRDGDRRSLCVTSTQEGSFECGLGTPTHRPSFNLTSIIGAPVSRTLSSTRNLVYIAVMWAVDVGVENGVDPTSGRSYPLK